MDWFDYENKTDIQIESKYAVPMFDSLMSVVSEGHDLDVLNEKIDQFGKKFDEIITDAIEVK